MSTRGRHVVVCGGGMAGLVAAVAALDAGAEVTVLEKGPQIGGSAIMSGGLVWTFRDLDELQRAVPDGNPLLQQLVHTNIDAGRRWLAQRGVHLGVEEPMLGHGRGQEIDPPQALGALRDRVLASGGTILVETALDALRTTPVGRVTGVVAARADGSLTEIHGDAVVLATGGFQGSAELLRRYLLASPDHLYLRANAWSTGDGLTAALDAGAAASPGLDLFYGHAMAAPPARFNQLQFTDVSQYHGNIAVAINLAGERFVDESAGTGEEHLNQHLARQPEGRGFYLVDRRMAGRDVLGGRVHTQTILDRAASHDAPMVVAGTLDELVEGLASLGVAPGGAARTLTDYNAACLAGTADRLSPPRGAEAVALTEPPFVAVGVKAAITFTMGGIAIDERTRVLRRAASSSALAQSISELRDFREVPIPGLYAAGCDTGNIHHGGYLGGLATALTTGRIAGVEAARAA